MTDIFATPAGALWGKIGGKKIGAHAHNGMAHNGIALPLSALHSKKSCGIGEFLDLIPLIDWCHHLKLDVLQLLPLNDSGDDPSPYNVLSSCALNPIFLSLRQLPHLNEWPEGEKELDTFCCFNATPHVDYWKVNNHKMRWLRTYFQKTKTHLLTSSSFLHFIATQPWVESYGLFKVLKDHNNKQDWHDWPSSVKHLSCEDHEKLVQMYGDDISFYSALQYLCFVQLKQVKEHAFKRSVLIEGDIPILISRDSADVWRYPSFFTLTMAAGAPPDAYNAEGQYWGLPLYNWEALKQDGYNWWKQRLIFAENFYHLYRIDHVLGFFRIWGIPLDRPSKEGYFVPHDQALWIPQGEERLGMLIQASGMLPLAEDLGAVSDEIRSCLRRLGICGLKVIRWERKWKEDRSFIPYSDYHPLSFTCVSTHDSETLEQWWQRVPEEASAFADMKGWRYEHRLGPGHRKQILWDSHHTPSLFHVNLLQEYLALFPELISEDPDDERINIPGTVLARNWTYRFRPSLEELIAHDGLKHAMRDILS